MDVLVKIVRYFGLWLLNPDYALVTVQEEKEERLLYVSVERIEGSAVWLERASPTDEKRVVCELARSLQHGIEVPQQVLRVADDGFEEKVLAPSQ